MTSNITTTYGEIIEYKPRGCALGIRGDDYNGAITNFKRGATNLLSLQEKGAIAPEGVDYRTPETTAAITNFIQWVRERDMSEWNEGVLLSSKEILKVCGADPNNRPLDKARRDCLIVKKRAYRKGGEKTMYVLSRPHWLGLISVLSANAAYISAITAKAMEDGINAIYAEDAIGNAIDGVLGGGGGGGVKPTTLISST